MELLRSQIMTPDNERHHITVSMVSPAVCTALATCTTQNCFEINLGEVCIRQSFLPQICIELEAVLLKLHKCILLLT